MRWGRPRPSREAVVYADSEAVVKVVRARYCVVGGCADVMSGTREASVRCRMRGVPGWVGWG
jgi:hypothetical protein